MSGYDLKGKVALVTGGSRGLGLAMAEALAAAGASVMLGDILEAEGKEAAKGLKGKAAFTKLDVTSEDSWEKAIAATKKELGGLDILVNNAGIEITDLAINVKAKDLLNMCNVNIVGTALGIRYGIGAMSKTAGGNGGSIINISSVAATIAFPGIMGYSGTKSAVDRMTRVSAVEAGKLGTGVRVNCIYPGLVPTVMGVQLAENVVEVGLFPTVEAAIGAVVEQTPLGRLGDPTDMADAVVFMASDASRFITGVGLPVDGGMGT
jgi:3alpha(or 20beta)-hydroxysteroid dehydrogenase